MRFGICLSIVVAGRQILAVRKTMTKAVVLVFLLLFVSSRAWSGDVSFFQIVNPGFLETASINSNIVQRIRPVIPNLEKLITFDQGEFVLNLFEDTHVSVTIARQKRTVAGQILWLGRITGVEHSYVLLIADNESISGEIIGGDFHYQIRPWQEEFHVVREMVEEQSFRMLSKASGNITLEAEVIVLVNKERAAVSLHPLSYDAQLTAAARGHAIDMAQNDYVSSYGQDGSTPLTRITAAGYLYNSAGENYSYGWATSIEVMNMWMNNSESRKNILNTTYCDMGVGYAYDASSTWDHYWVQDFGRKQGVSVCSPPMSTDVSLAAILSLLL